MSLGFFERIEQRAQLIDSALCVGLDPRVPDEMSSDEATRWIVEQNRLLIEATSNVAVVYKPNIAFYEAWGEAGILALRATLGHIPADIPVILDAKRGDIGPTAEAYARMAFEEFRVDAVTVSPYMGWDSVEPFARNPEKGVIVLCKTSNPGANDLQLVGVGPAGEVLYQKTADVVAGWGPAFGLVVAGNDVFALESIRNKHSAIWFLAPGIGAQGGTITACVQAGMNRNGWGVLPVVARSIAQASDPKKAAQALAEEFRIARDTTLRARATAARQGSAEVDAGSEPKKKTELVHGVSGGTTIPVGISTLSGPAADLKQRVLRGLIRNGCFKTGSFVLKSGETSPFYVDLRRVMSDPELLRDVGLAYASLIGTGSALGNHHFDRIAGIPVAGLPLAASASLTTGLPMIFPRMQAKGHGTGNVIEGDFEEGEEILLLDDLITTGKSKLEALAILRGSKLVVNHLVVLLERGTQGRNDMEAEGVQLHAFAHIKEFFPLCQDMGLISPEERKKMESYVGFERKDHA